MLVTVFDIFGWICEKTYRGFYICGYFSVVYFLYTYIEFYVFKVFNFSSN